MGLKVAVLVGGSPFEYQFSLVSGRCVREALEEAECEPVLVEAKGDLVSTLRDVRPDLCYIAMHGKSGEDGGVQSLLELLGIPYIGATASVCRKTWDKDALRSALETYQDWIGEPPVASWPQGVSISREAFDDMGAAQALDQVGERMCGGFPVVVKPARGASGRGVRRVEAREQLEEAVKDVLAVDERAVIEQWVEGVEMAVSIVGTGWEASALPPVEVVSATGMYDASARMTAGAVDFYAPVRAASLSDDEGDAQAIRAEVERAALEAYRALGLRDLARIDLVWDGAQARIFDVSVSPAMSESSLFPMACEAADLDLSDVLGELAAQYEG